MSVLSAHDGTVAQEYVHKLERSEVLLTGWRATGPDTYRVTAQWPHRHPFYASGHGVHDPLLAAESIRQTVPLLTHLAYGAPLGHRQAWRDFRFALDPAALAAATSGAIELRITCTDVVRRGGRPATVDMRVDILCDGRPLGTARTSFSNQSPAIYQRLRGPYGDLAEATSRALAPAPALAAHLVGRDRPQDVVLSPTGVPGRTRLRVDLTHPVLFDHPVDHAPGMLLLEAARQAAQATAAPGQALATGMDCDFIRYAELDAPCWIETEPLLAGDGGPDGQFRVLVLARQHESVIFSAAVTLTPAAALRTGVPALGTAGPVLPRVPAQKRRHIAPRTGRS